MINPVKSFLTHGPLTNRVVSFLSPSAVLLKLRRKIPGERRYYAEQEVHTL